MLPVWAAYFNSIGSTDYCACGALWPMHTRVLDCPRPLCGLETSKFYCRPGSCFLFSCFDCCTLCCAILNAHANAARGMLRPGNTVTHLCLNARARIFLFQCCTPYCSRAHALAKDARCLCPCTRKRRRECSCRAGPRRRSEARVIDRPGSWADH